MKFDTNDTTKKSITLSVFYPAFNEEANIRQTVKRTIEALGNIPAIGSYELIIVNDGSTDRTSEIAKELEKETSVVRLVEHHTNRGCGAALATGFKAAKYDYVFFTDADLQFDLRDITYLIEHIPKYKVVLGYRATRQDSLLRIIYAKGWNLLNRMLFGLKVRDIDCAFKLFELKIVNDIYLESTSAMFSAELLIRLSGKGISFKEVPVTHLPRLAGSPTGARPRVIVQAFRDMLILYSGELGDITQKQVIKFTAVGVVNTLVDFTFYLFLTRIFFVFSSYLVTTKIISFIIGSISSFTLNRYWTFAKRGRIETDEVARFYTTLLLSLIVNSASMYIFLHILGLHDITAAILATGITFVWNFTISKFWVWKDAKMVRKFQT